MTLFIMWMHTTIRRSLAFNLGAGVATSLRRFLSLKLSHEILSSSTPAHYLTPTQKKSSLKYFKTRSNSTSTAPSSSTSSLSKPKDWHKLSRVFYNERINLGEDLILKDSIVHYLSNVMRLKEGQRFRIFNSKYGEYLARIISRSKRNELTITIEEMIRSSESSKTEDLPLILYFAPIKKANMKMMLTKVTELGIQHLVPVITQNTNIESDDIQSYLPYLIESVEQCERLTIPVIYPCITLKDFISQLSEPSETIRDRTVQSALRNIPMASMVLFGRERASGESDRQIPLSTAINEIKWMNHMNENAPMFGFLCGPEGGFTSDEMIKLESLSRVKAVSLGPRILRAETASMAAVACISSAWDGYKYQEAKQ